MAARTVEYEKREAIDSVPLGGGMLAARFGEVAARRSLKNNVPFAIRSVPHLREATIKTRRQRRDGRVNAFLMTAVFFAATLSLPSSGFAQGKDLPSGVGSSVQSIVQENEIVVLVTKQARKLTLYRRGEVAGTFPVVLGVRPLGAKLYEGDLRTPEGVYAVSDKRSHDRWKYFIEFDYPNETDRRAHAEAVAGGTIPLFDNRMPGPGGAVGIHGNDRLADQASGRDWTKGCVAMRNEDVAVIYGAVDVGTPVIVLP